VGRAAPATGTPLSYQLAKVPTAGIVFLFNYLARRNLLFSAKPGPAKP